MTFDATFREIARKRLRGGGKTTGSEEITFAGLVGGRPVKLVSRVRLRDPSESFRTNAAHRLRDSKVGDAGHWVNLRVFGDVTDADLVAIGEMAREADERAVIVRRA